MSNKLLPCPCCGSHKVKIVGDSPCHWVFCQECDLESGQSVTIEGATRKWNARKPMEQILERLEEAKGQSFLTLANTGDPVYDFIYNNVLAYLDKAIEIVKDELN